MRMNRDFLLTTFMYLLKKLEWQIVQYESKRLEIKREIQRLYAWRR
jgi:hypothetical protein